MHGEESGAYAYGMWPVVIFNILLFTFFIVGFAKPTSKREWRSLGIFAGFIVALFAEMYGFPLTIYLLTSLMGQAYPVLDPFSHPSGHLVLVFLGLAHTSTAMTVLHLITNAMIFGGLYLVYLGWALIHDAPAGALVTNGIYRYIRHPQYLGFFLVMTGFLIQWPTLPTVIMWPILIVAYYRLALHEEATLAAKFGEEFETYRTTVPAFFPSLSRPASIYDPLPPYERKEP